MGIVLNARRDLLEMSEGKHLCATCANLDFANNEMLYATTITPHCCVDFAGNRGEGKRYWENESNTAIYGDDTVTEDNGAGYYVIMCPRYKVEKAWCKLLGVEIPEG